MRYLLPPVLLALAACGAGPNPDTPDARRAATPPPANEGVRSAANLAGEWRVAGIDGADFDAPYGIALSGDASQLWWSPRCAGIVRDYRIDGADIDFATPKALEEGADGAPPPVCAIGLPPRLLDVVKALDTADHVERTPQNGIRISGPRHSVTLFSQ